MENDSNQITSASGSPRNVPGVVAVSGNTAETTTPAVVEAADSNLTSLRQQIRAGLGKSKEKDAEKATNKNSATDADQTIAARALAWDALKNKPEYRTLKFGGDGLHVAIAALIYGRHAQLTRTEEQGLFVSLMTLPFLSEGQAAVANKQITQVANKLLSDFRPALSPVRFKAVEDVAKLLLDGVGDFSGLLPNSQITREIVQELNRKTASVGMALKRSWALSGFSFLQDLLQDSVSDVTDKSVHDAADSFARVYTAFLTKVQDAVSNVDVTDVTPGLVVREYSYDASLAFKSANVLKRSGSAAPAPTELTKDLPAVMLDLRKEVSAAFQDTRWVKVPFMHKTDLDAYRHELTKILIGTTSKMARAISDLSGKETPEVQNACVATSKRLTALYDRVNVLTARYGSCLSAYGLSHTDTEYYMRMIIQALMHSRTASKAPTDTAAKETAGELLHEVRSEIMSIIDFVVDENVEPSNIRDLRHTAAVAILSYFVDMHRAVMAFLDGTDIPETSTKATPAMGYISWLKSLSANDKGLFAAHTADDESREEGEYDEALGLPGYDTETDFKALFDSIRAKDGTVVNDTDLPAATIQDTNDAIELIETDPDFKRFVGDWKNEYPSLGDMLVFWTFHPEVRQSYRQMNTDHGSLLKTTKSAIEAALEDASAPSSPSEPGADAKPVEDPEVILARYKGDHAKLLAHHKNVPYYYGTTWGNYWEEYEANLKKGHGKKIARATRREEEDVVGILQFKRVNKFMPTRMFWRSYIKKPATTTPAVPVEPKPEEYKHYYFAYGSNLDAEQIAKRTPFAKLVGRAVLKNYKLTFVTYNYSWRGGVANVEPSEGDVVYGLLWHFTDDMLTKMDRFEGHPTTYKRHEVDVQQVTSGEIAALPDTIKACVYEIQDPLKVHDFYPASDRYYNQIKAGYEKHNMPVVLLEEAQKFSTNNKVERKSYTSTYYQQGWNGNYSGWDDDYGYDRRYDHGSYPSYHGQRAGTHTTYTATTDTRKSGGRSESSIFSPERWFIDMNKNWWEATEL
jgi:hypothetical protein